MYGDNDDDGGGDNREGKENLLAGPSNASRVNTGGGDGGNGSGSGSDAGDDDGKISSGIVVLIILIVVLIILLVLFYSRRGTQTGAQQHPYEPKGFNNPVYGGRAGGTDAVVTAGVGAAAASNDATYSEIAASSATYAAGETVYDSAGSTGGGARVAANSVYGSSNANAARLATNSTYA